MTRACPVCLSREFEELYSYKLVYRDQQSVCACNECGMIYASTSAINIDYNNSIYERPGALGSGESPYDKERLRATVELLKQHVPVNARVLDIGCAQGGMLDALKEAGFLDVCGIDPSGICVGACRAKGHNVLLGNAQNIPLNQQFDLIILSHVMEHLENPRQVLQILKDHLTPNGEIYIEVPDADNYTLPFFDFNSEHVNHFAEDTLDELIYKTGYCMLNDQKRLTYGRKAIPLVNGRKVNALWVLCRRRRSTRDMMSYIYKSKTEMLHLSNKLDLALEGKEGVVIWGAGEYLSHILPLISKPIFAIVDRNPHLKGKVIVDNRSAYRVKAPEELLNLVLPPSTVSIVVASIIAEDRIREDIKKLRLNNPVVSLGI